MRHERGQLSHTRAATPGWVLLGLAKPATAGPIARALYDYGLASVPAFDPAQVLLHLDGPQHLPFSVIKIGRAHV